MKLSNISKDSIPLLFPKNRIDFGATIIDTPGIRGFGLVEMEKQELSDYFTEFFALKSDCKLAIVSGKRT